MPGVGKKQRVGHKKKNDDVGVGCIPKQGKELNIIHKRNNIRMDRRGEEDVKTIKGNLGF